mmetsp:Transcript_18546/g.33610  ORF Transcript_18546/g.33610 Transcript_18546/m.33610 type:complete len:119 (+) Transcript_18546:415-771(+)
MLKVGDSSKTVPIHVLSGYYSNRTFFLEWMWFMTVYVTALRAENTVDCTSLHWQRWNTAGRPFLPSRMRNKKILRMTRMWPFTPHKKKMLKIRDLLMRRTTWLRGNNKWRLLLRFGNT